MKKALIAFISIWILASLINQYTGWSVQDLLPPAPVKVRTLTPQEEASFPPPVKIEEKFYIFTSRHPDVWSKPLYADKKTAILINWNGSNDELLSDFRNLLRQPGNQQAYQRKIYTLRSGMTTWKYDSAKQLLIETCGRQAACIVNPRTKEIAVLPNKDTSYLAAFLKKYQTW